VPEGSFPVLWSGSLAVVRTPAEVDVTNADEMREALLSVLNLGATAVVIDMTRATFCDSAGVSALVRAQRRASASGARLRIATQSETVLRLFTLIGLAMVVEIYPDVAAALQAGEDLRTMGDTSPHQASGHSGDTPPGGFKPASAPRA
jgi:anti-sigma B factor antagonist